MGIEYLRRVLSKNMAVCVGIRKRDCNALISIYQLMYTHIPTRELNIHIDSIHNRIQNDIIKTLKLNISYPKSAAAGCDKWNR